MQRSRPWGASAALVAVLTLALPETAHGQFGRAVGQLVLAGSDSGLAVNDVTVRFESPDQRVVGGLSNRGRFALFDVPPGEYRVRASSARYVSVDTVVRIVADSTISIRLPMRLRARTSDSTISRPGWPSSQ